MQRLKPPPSRFWVGVPRAERYERLGYARIIARYPLVLSYGERVLCRKRASPFRAGFSANLLYKLGLLKNIKTLFQ